MKLKSLFTKSRKVLQAGYSRSVLARRHQENEDSTAKVYVNVEFLRVIAYTNFFIMIFCTLFFQRYLVDQKLKDGPDEFGNTCGPFNGDMGFAVDPPVLPGEGFDVYTQSHLNRAFGYNNICSNWDYSPSREVTAMIYPIFEYALLLYLFFDFIQVYVYYKKGWVSKYYFRAFQCAIVIMTFGVSWFRMIFVVIAYDDLSGHTAGFFGFQLTMIITAVMNTIFVIDTKTEFKYLGGRTGTLIAAYTYLLMQCVIGPIKLILTGYIVFRGEPASWSLNKIGSLYVGEFVDMCWFGCNAILPLCIAIIRAMSEPPLKVSIDCPVVSWCGEESLEKSDEDPLTKSEEQNDAEPLTVGDTDKAYA